MKTSLIAAALLLAAAALAPAPVLAQSAPSCKAASAEKKLAGAAKTSFTKKCVADAVGA